jgi:hypothetical protein
MEDKIAKLETTVKATVDELSKLRGQIAAYSDAITGMRRDIKCLIKHAQNGTERDDKAECMIMAWNEALQIINRQAPRRAEDGNIYK